MRVISLLLAASALALLSSCAGNKRTSQQPTHQGRVLTGITEYYYRGYTPPPVNSPAEPSRHSWLSRAGQDKADGSGRGNSVASTATHTHGTVFANPDGTTSRIEYGAMVRSDGRKDWIIGNTVFHSNGTRTRIVGDTLINPDGTRSRKVQ